MSRHQRSTAVAHQVENDGKASVGTAADLAGRAAICAAGYFACGVVGTVLSVPPAGFAIIWPVNAWLLAALLVTAPRHWWIYAASVLPTHFVMVWASQPTAIRWDVALTQVSGNLVLAAACAGVALRIDRGPVRFDRFRSVFLFVLLPAVAIPLVGNAGILSFHMLTGWTDNFWLSWRQWALAGIFPTATLTPLLVTIARGRDPAEMRRPGFHELAITFVAVFALSFVVFGQKIEAAYWPTLLLLPLPLLLWSAVRQGIGGCCLSLQAFAAAIIVEAFRGRGPFGAASSIESTVSLQVFLTAVSIFLVLMAAAMEEWQRSRDLLRRADERAELVTSSTGTGLWQWQPRSQSFWVSSHCHELFDLTPQGLARPESFLDVVHPGDRRRVAAAWRAVHAGTQAEGSIEFRVDRARDGPRWLVVKIHVQRDRAGTVSSMSGVVHDVTERIAAQQEAERLARRLLALQDGERRTIAQELHDSTAQHLVALGLHAHALRRPSLPMADASRLWNAVDRELDNAIREIRDISYSLRPAELDGTGLHEALERFAEGFTLRTGLSCDLRASPSCDWLALDQQHLLYRIVQERLAEVHKHAGATRVSVRLRREAFGIHLRVRDDGQDPDPATRAESARPPLPGAVLPGIAVRAQQLGGKLVIRSLGKGTSVHVAMPLPQGSSEMASGPIRTSAA